MAKAPDQCQAAAIKVWRGDLHRSAGRTRNIVKIEPHGAV
jgi:hypothetical protein